MRGFSWFLIVFVHFCGSYSKKDSFQGPQISVRDGHLIITAYGEKNINFQTSPAASVMINDIDVLPVLQEANKATKFVGYYQNSYSLLTNRLSALEQRILYLPGYLNSTPSIDPSIRRLNRRVLTLQRTVNTLRTLLAKDECAGDPCENEGYCQDLFDNYMCQCRDGWEGHDCSVDVNECAKFAGTDLGCQNGATCVNKPGTYECLCQNGYIGIHCTRKTADCATGGVELCGHGICVPQNTPLGYKCICDQGWTTDAGGRCIVDVDECNQNHPSCFTNVACHNLPGSYTCGPCPQGFTGNGYRCDDINECEYLNGHCSMNPMVLCTNTPGSRTCGSCPAGYYGDGINCMYRGVCNVNNGECHYLAQCRDNPRISTSYVECICPAGYVGNGIGPNGCVRSPYQFNPCASNPCKSGTCSENNVTGDYVCLCNRRYTGRNCDILKDPCASNPCLNGGTCASVFNLSFKCTCPKGYTGQRCEVLGPSCGGQLHGFNGTLKYPEDLFVTYDNPLSCSWTIETDSDKVLNITFKKFDFKQSEHCRKGWLQLHDGGNSAARGLGRFCGNTLPLGGNIVSTHNIFYLWFRSDARVTKDGFELTWNTTYPVCGGIINVTSHGSIQSPGSPGMYPPNRDCYWTLNVPITKRLLFHFYSLSIGQNVNCERDYLEFSTGLNQRDDTVFAKFCNSSIPAPFHSLGPTAVIHFHSDAQDSYPGFQLTYSIVEGVPGCGGTYTAEYGIIQSLQSSPDSSETNICEYTIMRPFNTKLKLTFLTFNLFTSPGCRVDFLEIREGPNTDSPLVDRYCDLIPPPVISYNNQLTILSSTSRHSDSWKLKYESVCLQKFTETSGQFISPNKSKVDCIYQIERPPGYKIELVLKLSTSRNCVFGSLEVRDGDNANATLIDKYCQNTTEIITSTYNSLWIHYTYKTTPYFSMAISGYSFEASYTSTDTGCGGILRDKKGGSVASPIHPDGYYPPKLRCTWVIIAPPRYVVRLTWNSFSVENSHECSYDKVLVYDNNTELGTGDLMGKFCGITLPTPLQTLSNIMTIVFITDFTIHWDGFLATYNFVPESTVCGGNYYTSSGFIQSLKYPNEYPNNQECTWTITVSPNQQIMLNITDFDLEIYRGCRYDYLEIRNGGTAASPLIGRYCGTTIPRQIPSHSNQLSLKFKSDTSRSGKGFRITWSSTSTGCGGTLSSSSGSVMSPQYPEPYNRNTECSWRISVSAGSLIQLVFSDIDLERHPQCLSDYVEIFDGSKTNTKSLGKYCSGGGSPIVSTGNQVVVIFRADVAVQGRGFRLHYTTMCHNTLRGFRGVIESPNFHSGSYEQTDCLWDIIVADKNKINITFSHINFERTVSIVSGNFSCLNDYIEIKYLELDENEYSEEPKFITAGKYCYHVDIPNPITVNSDHAQVRFVSKIIESETSFRLEWQLFGCGGILTHTSGTIQSPNYPKAYPASVLCQWIIQLDYIYSVQIDFYEIDVERDTSCSYDSITIYNGPDNSSNVITKLCHQKKPVTLSTTGNFMYIEFKADYNYQGKGFTANYSAIPAKCGGHFTAPEGSIFSSNYPKNYNINDSCAWLIEVDENHSINLEFEDVDLWKSCDTNYVKVHDGPTAAYPVLSKVCGNEKPNATINSTFNELYIEFKGHPYFSTKGFLAKYHKSCGSRITTQGSGIIEINHNEFSSYISTCIWTIVSTDPSRHVTLTITHVDLQSYYCDSEDSTIQIFGGESTESPLIKNFCGPKVPPPIISDGSAITILLTTEMDFSATYSILDSHCGGTYTSEEGYFSTPRYPKQYATNMQCEWTIQAAAGNHLTLSFIEFDLIASDKCNTDYLEIRRNNASGTLLGVYCGRNTPENITHEGSLWMLFKSSKPDLDTTISAKGFYGEYSLDHVNELTGSHGLVASPMYPNRYNNFGKFSWKIMVGMRHRIMITFKEFYVETDPTDECYYATFMVYDGVDETAPLIKTLCGFDIPGPIMSSSNIVFVEMSYNSVRMGAMFLFEWLEVSGSQTNTSKSYVEGCGSSEVIDINRLHNFTMVTSPGYPDGYAPNLNCEWIFSTISMNHLKYYFADINLQTGGCHTDYVALYQKHSYDNDWQPLSTVCNMDSVNADSAATDLLKMKFVTNRYLNGTGFKAYVYEACGGSMFDRSGYIVYDKSTSSSFECQWNVTVRPGRKILLTFVTLNIPKDKDSNCKNYIMVRNGKFPDSPLLGQGKYCGRSPINSLESTGNYLYIKYKGGVTNVNFKLKYQEVPFACGGKIVLSEFDRSVEITSPNYPNIPSPHTECIWLISAPPGLSLRIDFEERFDLSNSKDCSIEYVELRDGGTEYSPSIGRYCKSTAPGTQFSTDNMLFLKFVSDTDEPKNGFKAKILLAFCGGTLRGYTGTIRPPPQNGETKINCTWYIVGPVDHYLTLQVESIKTMKEQTFCLQSHMLTVSEPEIVLNSFRIQIDKKERMLGQYCGTTSPPPFNSSSNKATINFVGNNNDKFLLTFNASKTVCGGSLVKEWGTIKSPGYPGTSHVYRQCIWSIQVPEGRRVKLNILDLDLGLPHDAQTPGLVIYDGPPYVVSIIYLIPGSAVKGVYESSSNIMTVRYWSSENFYHRGFKSVFSSNDPTICKGDFTADTGVLTQPMVRNNSYWCKWTHTGKSMYLVQTLALTVTYNTNATRVRGGKNNFWYLRATNQDNKEISNLYQISERNHIIRSPFPTTKLEAVTGRRFQMNFTVSYTIHECGGIVRGEQGTITSLDFPANPLKSAECVWLIKVNDGQAINLTTSVMDLGSDCEKSYLSIYNGDLPTYPRIGKYCHNNKANVISQRNSLWIEYKYTTGSSGTGFKLQYEAIEEGCGGIFHDRSRIIQSPSYGNGYPSNAECLWEVRSDVGYSIKLEFIHRFYLEESEGCKNDYVEIWDWQYDAWVSLGKKCGRNTPKAVHSTGDKLKVLFRTNKDIAGTGFKAKWDWQCGGNFEASKTPRYVVSPGYPVAYFENLNCVYNIKTKGEVLNIRFDDFELEKGSPSCRYDNVTIRGKYYTTYMPTSQIFCGTNNPRFLRLRETVTITFQTDHYISKKGFKFMFKDESCGEEISKEQILEYKKPPTYAMAGPYYHYFPRVSCIWKVTAPPKKVVVFKLHMLNVSYSPMCFDQGVKLYNSLDQSYNKLLAALCSYITDGSPIVSETGKLLVKLDVNPINYGGFKAEVYFSHGPTEGCGGLINLTETKTIQSPDLADLDCHWKITAPRDYQVQIYFSQLNIPVSCTRTNNATYNFCSCSYIEIYDGPAANSELISKLCSHANTSPFDKNFTTTSNSAFIRFFLMGVQNNAFKATLTPVLSRCGPSILNVTKEIKTITTPNYPNEYPEGIKCSWAFETPNQFSKIALHFVDFDLLGDLPLDTEASRCDSDRVQIMEDPKRMMFSSGTNAVMYQGQRKQLNLMYNDYLARPVFCGKSETPFDYYSSGKALTLAFRSTDSQVKKGKGFKLEYSLAGCNRNFTSLQGRVSNGNDKSKCIVTITVPENRTIALYFLRLQMPFSMNCTQGAFEVRDSSSTGKLLLSTCGYRIPNPQFSYTNKLYIQTTYTGSNPYILHYDFVYTSTENGRGCGGEFYNYKGKLSSPFYPDQYRNDSVCKWIIRVPMEHQVALKFTNFDLQGSCESTYVIVTTYSSGQDSQHQFCKGDNPSVLRSDYRMEVQYSSTIHNGGTGWMAVFQAIGFDITDVL